MSLALIKYLQNIENRQVKINNISFEIKWNEVYIPILKLKLDLLNSICKHYAMKQSPWPLFESFFNHPLFFKEKMNILFNDSLPMYP